MRLTVLLVFLAALPTALEAQKNCTKGIPCGNTCIAANKTCRVGTTSARPAPPATTVAPASALKAEAPATSGEWVASTRGRTYYKAGCSGARKLSAANLTYFKTEDEARAAGYTRSVQRGC